VLSVQRREPNDEPKPTAAAEDLDSSQGVRDHLVAYHLAPAITDFISDENRVCCNNDFE